MKNKSLIGVILTAILAAIGYGGYTLGDVGSSAAKFNVYGSETGTTAVTSTSKTIYIGSKNEVVNLSIKASSTHSQTISFYPELSNDSDDCSTATYFRGTNLAVSGGAITITTSTYSLLIPSGPSYNSVQIANLNTECLKLTFTGSAAATTSMLWIEGSTK